MLHTHLSIGTIFNDGGWLSVSRITLKVISARRALTTTREEWRGGGGAPGDALTTWTLPG